jgi:integrase
VQFRWLERGQDGKRICRKRVTGTVERYRDSDTARHAVAGLVTEINSNDRWMKRSLRTVARLCDHFEQRELAGDNIWRSDATKKIYKAYLRRWRVPHWGHCQLSEIRTIQVESWLRSLAAARSTCARIRNVMSILFNHACRYEFFDRNPIILVRQRAKRRTVPSVFTPAEIKALVDGLALRERTLVLLAASTGLRQSELFGLR